MELKDFGPAVVKVIQGRNVAIGAFSEFGDGQGHQFFCPECVKKILREVFPIGKDKQRSMTDEEFDNLDKEWVRNIENLDVSGEPPEFQAIWAEIKERACSDRYIPFEIPLGYKNLFTADEIDIRAFAFLRLDSEIICSKCKAVCR